MTQQFFQGQMPGTMMQDGFNQIRRGMQASPQMAQNAQAALQPQFGTNPQQVRQDIARDLAYGSQQQQGGFTQQTSGMMGGGMIAGGMMDGSSMMSAGMQSGANQIRRGMQGSPQMAQNVQSVLQPQFGTNPQQVRQDITRDLAYGNQQQQGGFTQQTGGMMGGSMMDGSSMMSTGMQSGANQIRRGMQGSPQMAQNVQSVLQPQFGTNPQQVRDDIARDLAYGSQQQQGGFTQQAGGMMGGMTAGGMMDGSMMSTGMQSGGSQIRRGMQGSPQMAQNVQSVFQPQFGTNPQQVRQDIARDLANGSQQQGMGQQMSSLQSGMSGASQGSFF